MEGTGFLAVPSVQICLPELSYTEGGTFHLCGEQKERKRVLSVSREIKVKHETSTFWQGCSSVLLWQVTRASFLEVLESGERIIALRRLRQFSLKAGDGPRGLSRSISSL